MRKWVLAPTSICERGAIDQTAAHVILECPSHRASRGYHGLLVLNHETMLAQKRRRQHFNKTFHKKIVQA